MDLKHKDTKGQSFFLDIKVTSDLKVATKPCGWETLWALLIVALFLRVFVFNKILARVELKDLKIKD